MELDLTTQIEVEMSNSKLACQLVDKDSWELKKKKNFKKKGD